MTRRLSERLQPVLLGLVAVATMIAVAVGVATLVRRTSTPVEPGGGPLVTASATTTDPGSAPASTPDPGGNGSGDGSESSGPPDPSTTDSPEPRTDLGKRFTFEHFTVRVDAVRVEAGQGVLVTARVCVRSLPPGTTGTRTRISWDPWRVTADGSTGRARLADGSHPPDGLFPPAASYAVGECARGVIPFAGVSTQPTRVSYGNSLGDKARWRVG